MNLVLLIKFCILLDLFDVLYVFQDCIWFIFRNTWI